MKYIREILAWFIVTMSHAPILALIAYMVYVYLGGIFHEKIHTSILLCEAIVLGLWIFVGYTTQSMKIAFKMFPLITLVVLCVALGSLGSYEFKYKVFVFTSYFMCAFSFLLYHVYNVVMRKMI